MNLTKLLYSLLLLTNLVLHGQQHSIFMKVNLDVQAHELQIQQKTTFVNTSDNSLDTLFFHNWPNAFKDKHTPLSKRLIESYDKAFYFSKDYQRGYTTIEQIKVSNDSLGHFVPVSYPDVIGISLKKPLASKDSIEIYTSYTVKIPLNRYTSYGRTKDNYYLRYWYLIPAILDTQWQLQNNLDMDDLMVNFTNYTLEFTIPNSHFLTTDLDAELIESETFKRYKLSGNNRQNIVINISKKDEFIKVKTQNTTLITDLASEELNTQTKSDIAQRAFNFIQEHLGPYPHNAILVNQVTYNKYPVYGFNQLPNILNPFPDVFEWDIKLFKTLARTYLENTFSYQKRTDYWLIDGLQTYLMMRYVDQYYPEIKAIGNVSKVWLLNTFNIAKLNFNDKYAYLFQLSTHANLDQALNTRSDSLSNFNRKIASKYKAGLGLNYLDHYLNHGVVSKSIKEFYQQNKLKSFNSDQFTSIIKSNTTKKIDWFENEYLTTNKKIDYTLKKVSKETDSIKIVVKNKSDFTAPIQLYGLKKNEIVFNKWYEHIDSTAVICIPKNGFDRLALNYEFNYPENNLRNNWKFIEKRLINRPIQVRFINDIDNPYYNQLMFLPEMRYNYYDGFIFGLGLHNKTFLDKNFKYKLLPSISTKTATLSGLFSLEYDYLPQHSLLNVYKYRTGIIGSHYQYAPNLSYNTLIPYAVIEFNRKSLRDVGSRALIAKYVIIDREIPASQLEVLDSDRYKVFSLRYGYSNPNIIDELKYSVNYQYSNHFSKASFLVQYRKLTDRRNRQLDLRFYAGTFLFNHTNTNFFDFSLSNASDYLFEYDYLGRSESSGIFSQQVIINEGGFKSILPTNKANQWITTLNTSIGIWRWIEVYNDFGWLKNKNESVYFAHENGIRMNFVNNYFELYFPIHSNNGWEIAQPNYETKIRFVFTTQINYLFNLFRRGFF